MSFARSFLNDPHGMIFIHASCDQPLINSPITKLTFVILSEAEESMYALLSDPSSLASKLCQDDSMAKRRLWEIPTVPLKEEGRATLLRREFP